MTLGEYVEAMITEYYDWKDGKIMTGEMRTLAAQIPAELFDRLDRYLKERGIKKKDFLVDIITPGTGLPGGQVFAQLDGQSFEMRSILKTKTAHW